MKSQLNETKLKPFGIEYLEEMPAVVTPSGSQSGGGGGTKVCTYVGTSTDGPGSADCDTDTESGG